MGDGSGHFPFGAGREAMKVPQATVIAATANRRDAQGHMHQRGCLGRHSRISRHRRVAGGCKSAYHQENDHSVDVLGLPQMASRTNTTERRSHRPRRFVP